MSQLSIKNCLLCSCLAVSLLGQPQMKTAGIIRRTGDVQIWLSGDRYKVPVKIVTSIALGQVTIELISVESKQADNHSSQ
jgi:hypothetical protein